MPCLRRARAARDDEREQRHSGGAGRQQPRLSGQDGDAGRRRDEHGRQHRERSREVARRVPDELDQVDPAAAGDAGVEAAGEHEVGEPERDPEHADGAEGPERLRAAGRGGRRRRRPPARRARARRTGCVATVARIASAQSAHARLSPRSSARSRARYESALVKQEEAVHPPVDRRGRGTSSSTRRSPLRAGPARVRRGAPRAARRPGGSRRRRAPRAPGALRARSRGARPPRRAGSGAARRRAPRARPGTARRAGAGRRRAAASRPRAAARRAAGGRGTPAAAAASAATPSPNQWAATHARTAAPSRAPIRLCLCGLGHRCRQFSLLAFARHADLRVPLSRRAYLRGLPADGGRADREVRSVRQEPRREGALPGLGPLQGLRLLLDRLRQGRPQEDAEPPKDGGSSDSGSSDKKSDKDSGAGEKKAAAAD